MAYLRWSKQHEPVRYELSGSGVPPVRRCDLGEEPLPLSLELTGAYGDPDVIREVSSLYGCPRDWVVPVPGTGSANFIALAIAADRGSPILLEHPGYEPIDQAARLLGHGVIPLSRRWQVGFSVDPAEVQSGLDAGAKVVVLSNLHNPSGQLLARDVIGEIARRCANRGATLIVDEVYLDAVHLISGSRRWTAALAGDNVIATGSLTKVYGLGALRAGWLIASTGVAERARDVMDVLSAENTAPAAALARHALSKRAFLEDRYRRFHREGQRVFRKWIADEPRMCGYRNHGALFECLRLRDGVDADHLCELLVSEYDTQVVPGRFFGLDGHIRLGVAHVPADLEEALSRISLAVAELAGR